MRSGLVSLLANESTITAIVSSRIYISKAPQGAGLPHIVITQIGSDEFPALDGTPSLRFVDFDIDCKADRSVTAETLSKAVRAFIDDYTGTAGLQTIGAVLLNGESTDYEPPQDGSDTGIHTALLDVNIQYAQA
ncbi:MAG: DUF3168 domain-containing protein [Planctomycetaceae bacterium]